MKILTKTPNKDFVILNLTDPQLSNEEWSEGHNNRRILEYTITTLIERVKPDLITISGDLSWAGHFEAYDKLAQFLESFKIAWSPVWGNHDNQLGGEFIEKVVSRYLTYEHCVYERGEKSLGNGNYIIGIKENEKLVHAIFMMDTHDREPFIKETGESVLDWARLTKPQIEWYSERAKELKEKGCNDAGLIVHIPIYAYRNASKSAFKSSCDLAKVHPFNVESSDCWTKGYENSVGVQHEGVASYSADDKVFEVLKTSGIAKYVIAGHDHVNNWIINYQDIQLVYALKVGPGCYWDPLLNGGTVLKINSNGVYDIHHEYVDVSKFL